MCCDPTPELITKLKKLAASKGRDTYAYTFITSVGEYSGDVQRIEDEFVVVRVKEGYREHEDVHVRLCCLCAIREQYSAE